MSRTSILREMGRILIIGGGAIGLGLAWQLSRRGAEVTVLERNGLTSGTSWHAAGIVGPLRATASATRIAMAANELIPELEAETGMQTGYRQTGGFWLARVADRMDELNRIAALGRHMGLTPEIIHGAPLLEPMNRDGIVGSLAVAEDASVNPVDLCMAYAKGAKNAGARIQENAEVAEILTENARALGVRLADGSVIEAATVVLCAGAWSPILAKPLGISLPLQAVQHMYVVTEPIAGLPDPFPVLRDLDRGLYVKGDAGKLVIGGFETDAIPWDAMGPEGNRPFLELPENWDQFTPFMEAALDLIPKLADTGILHFMNGPESFTVDTRPLIGPPPAIDGLYVAAGMNSVGVMSSAGIGRALANWILDRNPGFDLWEMDVARSDPLASAPAHLANRMKEAVADVFALHWPYKQPKAGRDLRRSALHECWVEAGAVFGVTAGWERPLWFAESEAECDLPYATGAQHWWPIAKREACAMAEGTALIDLSPFTKIDVAGPGALGFLQWLATSDVDVTLGRVIYTQFLNGKGGIEADLTVTRLADDAFRITSGAATRWKDLAHLRRAVSDYDVTINDRTEDEAVIGVMGPNAMDLLGHLSSNDAKGMAFSSARNIRIGGHKVRATRLSYVGEAGCELSVPVENAAAVFALLRQPGISCLGHYALDGCRIEKGFRHWGHDIGPDVSPLEAALGFTIAWDKPDFVGRNALLAERDTAARRKLVLMDVEGAPLLLHDEPIWADGKIIGLTTSGARGPRTEQHLAFGLIELEPGGDLPAKIKIEVAGDKYSARILPKPPYDPTGQRMRA